VNRVHGLAPRQTGSIDDLKARPRAMGEDFGKVLNRLASMTGLKFSRHALNRLASRGLRLDRVDLEKLGAAVDAARSKGANESLVLMDELALIVSVKNRTVITAMAAGETRGNVFTSIDSTVIA